MRVLERVPSQTPVPAHGGDVVGGKDGHQDGQDDEDGQDNGRRHAGFVLAEAPDGVPEEGGGLGFQLGVHDALVRLDELEVVVPELDVLFFVAGHYFFAPILIRGSMKP